MKKKIILLGCTGSIGKSTLAIVRQHPQLFQITALSAYSNEKDLLHYCKEFGVTNYVLTQKSGQAALLDLIKKSPADIVVNAISGAAGLPPSITALECGYNLALANKETIVMAGRLIKNLAKNNDCALIPVDSEHSAVFALIDKFGKDALHSVILTASGGPFRSLPKEQLATVTLEAALKHPSWSMGQKITIDSASLANKGLEVIEACRLFDLSPDSVKVVIHPESYVHSLITTVDGILYAQISKPDMRHPLFFALTYPQCITNQLEVFDITKGIQLNFAPPRFDDFPMLDLAYQALKAGESHSIIYNAVNEVAVEYFMKKKISFMQIAELTAKILSYTWEKNVQDFSSVFQIDDSARKLTKEFIGD